jgi:asparaginyl-tRNA synthetase
MTDKVSYTRIKKINSAEHLEKTVHIRGWIRSIRKSKKFAFFNLNDGSSQSNMQIILDNTLENYEELTSLLIGSAVSIEGVVKESHGKGQNIEMHATTGSVIAKTDESYPLQKKATSLEHLREIAHLRVRTQTFGAITRLSHNISFAIHQFFHERGFYHVHTPTLTAIDAEGAGEMFTVTTGDLNSKVDFNNDFFGKRSYLAVTGQLEAECLATGIGNVYTFGPTYRAENSNTPRHLCEFWMVEPEMSFMDLEETASLSCEFIQYLIAYAFEHCKEELDFLAATYSKDSDHLENLKLAMETPFTTISYTEAIDILKESKKSFEFKPDWGVALQTEHERFLTDEHFKSPVAVLDYPADCKAFYMKQSEDGKTVRAMDLLVPGIGEIIGGSQREEDFEKLQTLATQKGIDVEHIWWYMDLRKYASIPHSGFGLGFERCLMYLSGMSNIRDMIPFPRTPKAIDF